MGFREDLEALCGRIDGSFAASLMGFDGIAIETAEVKTPEGVELATLLIEYSGIISQIRQATDTLAMGKASEVSIRTADGQEVPVGEAGELCVRGPQVMRGYWQRPLETAAVMTADGFLRTGDVAVMDENGFLKLVDRLKDMILVSGFNVYPNEIEEVVMRGQALPTIANKIVILTQTPAPPAKI